MDQPAEVGSVDSASSTDETLMGNLDTEGQIEGSFVGENGDDDGEEGELMVEVVGSDVIFDGVVSHGDDAGHVEEGADPGIGTFDGGGRQEGGTSRIVTETEVSQHGDAGCSDQEAQNVVGEASEVIVQSIREKIVDVEETAIRHSEEEVTEVFQCGEASCSGPNADKVVGELDEVFVRSAEQTEVFAVEIVRRSSEDGVDTVAENFQHIDAVFDQEGRDVVGEVGKVVLQSSSEPTKVVDKDIVERPSEKCVERVMVEEGVHNQSVDGGSGVDGFRIQKVGGLDSEAWNPGIEAPVGQLPLREESSSVQNQVVSEEVTDAVEGEGAHHEDGAPDGNFMEVELRYSEKDQSSEAEVVYFGTDKGQQAEGLIQEERHLEVGHSSLREESSTVQNQVVSEEATMAVQGEGPHQEDGVPDAKAELPYPEKDQSSEAEVVYMGTVKDGIGSADADVACQQAEASIKVERELMNKEDSTAERGDVTGMDTEQNHDLKDEAPGHDTLNDIENYIDKEQSLKVKRVNRSSENDVAYEHPECSEKPNEFANKGDVLMGNIGEDDRKCDQAVSADSNLDSLKNNFSSPEDDVTPRAVTESESLLPSDLETSLVAKREITELDAKKDPGSRVEISNGDTCHRKDENLDAQTASGNPQNQGDPSVNFESSGPQGGAETQVESMAPRCQGTVEVKGHTETGFRIAVQDTACIDHSVVGENENRHSTTPITITVEMKHEMIDQPAQPPGTLVYEMDHNEPTFNVDEVSNKEMSIAALPDAITNITDTSQAPVDPGLVDSEIGHVASSVSHFANPLSDGCQYLDVHVVNCDVSMLQGNQTRDIHVSDEMILSEGMNEATERNDEPCEIDENCDDACVQEIDVPSLQDMEVDDQFTDGEHAELTTEADPLGMSTDVTFIAGSSEVADRSSYLLPPESEGEFSVSDLVWGKVRSHPWWPGQIFNPADASEKAIRYHKRDCFLVAYFGDRTFAWNDASLLKPLWSHFSQIEKQSNSEAFHNAVSCALKEVSRRFELGLACSCIPKDVYDKIECQSVESTGIREESSRRFGVDKSTGVSSFQPDKLLEYVRALALSPSGVTDRLEVAIAKAQLLAFCRFKGFCQLPEFQYCGGLVKNDVQTSDISETVEHAVHEFEELKSDDESSHKRKHNLKDDLHPKKKEKSLVELMVDAPYSPDDEDGSAKRRKAVDSTTDGSDRGISFHSAKVSTAAATSPKPSFKVGECIRRVASQLTGSASIVKGNSDLDVSLQTAENFQRGKIPTECSSLDQILSQLYVAARDPMKGYSFLKTIIDFFSGFRNSIILSQHSVRQNSSAGKPGSGRKRKPSQVISCEEFEFDDVNDSYWTDRIIQNYSEEQLLNNGENGGAEYAIVAFEPDKSLKSSRRSNSRKRYSSGNHEVVAVEPSNHVDEKMLDLSPAELILSFAEGDSIPSESNLNKIFRRFGPLKESDTEIDVLSSRARVVFKKGSDAKVALNSAGKFNIFGPKLVNYELSYSPASFKYVPLMISEGQEDAI